MTTDYSPGFFLRSLLAPGQHPFFFQGGAGAVEAVLTVPEALSTQGPFLAIVGHPHSLYGGSMDNKVVTTTVRAFAGLGIPSIRFNFRGVGQTAGAFDAGIGESEDMILLAKLWSTEQPSAAFMFAGFSFGSYVVFRAAKQCPTALLLSIAPPVHHFEYQDGSPPSAPWIIIQGTEDEIVPYAEVFAFSQQFDPPLEVLTFEGAGHFFHGQLVLLKEKIMQQIRQKVLDKRIMDNR